MSKKGSASQPAAPDPSVVDAAQTQSNEQTAAYNQQLNMINTAGPDGSVTYSPSSAPGGYTQTTSLSPAEQAIFNQQTAAEGGALGIANDQLGRVSSALGTSVDPSSYGALSTTASGGQMPTAPGLQTGYGQGQGVQGSYNPGAPVQTSIGPQGSIATGYGAGGQIQGQVAPGVQGGRAVQNAADAAYGNATQYLTPQYQQQNEQLQAQLTAQGLNPNDAAWQNAETLQNNQQNQGYQGAINAATAAGDAEQATLYGQALQSGEFANSAQGQANSENAQAAAFGNSAQQQGYAQAMGEGQFADAAQQQLNTENAQQAQFGNSAAAQQYAQSQGDASFYNTADQQSYEDALAQQQQQFGQSYEDAQLGNTAQQQAFQQGTYAQELPINELSSLLGLGQVSSPTGINYTPSEAGSTNVLGAYGLQSQVEENNYNQQLAQQNDLLGGLFGLGSAAIKSYSDARLKDDIRLVGRLGSGLGVYSYRFRGSRRTEIGVLAQEAAFTHPHAVSADGRGFLMVDYGALS